ncbi:MAG TPA: hypothetical protein VKK19_16755 [Candidatus Dormibacteraeota bacterium]|nr:hypothetical protein [Candidatus Dormibacteraeota bacterium]
MAVIETRPVGVHLVGSLALDSAEEVFRATSEILGERLRRIPDGETGPRSIWVGWQYTALSRVEDLEAVERAQKTQGTPLEFRPRSGVDPRGIDLGSLGYAPEALTSYAVFQHLKAQGTIPPRVRFQVALPTPFSGTQVWVERGSREALTPAFERAMRTAVEEVVESIPANEMAIQWDVCLEVGFWDRPYFNFLDSDPMDDATQATVLGNLGELGDLVPAGVELGYHLCYGDWGHQHFKQPDDAGKLVEMANGISAAVRRRVDWIHLPVPRDRDDAAYFEPLRALALQPGCELYLGLVHYTDGVEGTDRRIATARRFVTDFGVATECGMGRRPEGQDIRELLRIHRDVSAPVR